MKRIAAVAFVAALAACSSQPKAPYVPPDTPAGKIRTIAFMPHFGQPIAPAVQVEHAKIWAEWWEEVYPGVKWSSPTEATAQLLATDSLDVWAGNEKTYLQTGQFTPAALGRLCAQTKTAGVMQGSLFSAQSGTSSSWFRPFWAADGTPGSARMTLTLFNCTTLSQVWTANADVIYVGDYSVSKMVEYAFWKMYYKIRP